MRRIDGVEIHDLQLNADERGHLVEVFEKTALLNPVRATG